MKTKDKIILVAYVAGLLTIWGILAFTINEGLIPRVSLWVSLIVGTASTIISVIALLVSVNAYKKNEEEKVKKLIEEARLFLHDNNDEIDFLPYCVYASCYDRHGHHVRKIYNEFCRLSDDMQKEVLVQANYKMSLIDNSNWISSKIELINKFAEEYGFGDSFLYEAGKHFLNGYKTKDKPYIEEHNEELIDAFGMFGFMNRILQRKAITIDQYFEGYGYRKFRDPKWLERYGYEPPCDLLIDLKELRDAEKTDSSVVAYWMCHEIEDIFAIIVEYFYGNEPNGIIHNDAIPEFFEDKFYKILNILYCLDDYSKYQLIKKEPYDKEERDKIENSDKR